MKELSAFSHQLKAFNTNFTTYPKNFKQIGRVSSISRFKSRTSQRVGFSVKRIAVNKAAHCMRLVYEARKRRNEEGRKP